MTTQMAELAHQLQIDPDEEDRRCECSMMATIEEARRALGLEE